MSGIVGIINRTGQTVSSVELDRMLHRIRYRGPDGLHTWIEGNAGFGHCMLQTTPESLWETLPLLQPHPRLLLTADARIDNRDDLIPMLDLCPRSHNVITDSEIILSAYLRWGLSCPERLEGDFAFAIWDPGEQTLFCARDPMGIKPFYYTCSAEQVAFGSELRALLALKPYSINEQCIADYLCNHNNKLQPTLIEPEMTLFQDLLSLLPGSWLKVTPHSYEVRCYWHPDPEKELHMDSDRDYAEAFLDLFRKAVSARLRSAFPVGIQLSGGLDSSSVACVADDLNRSNHGEPLATFSAIFPTLPPHERRLIDERIFLNAIHQQRKFVPHMWVAEGNSPLRKSDHPDHIYWHEDSWFLGPNLYLTRMIHQQAQQQGTRVILDGHEGDLTVSHGFTHLMELARSGQWIELALQVKAVRTVQKSPWQIYRSYVRKYGLAPLKRWIRSDPTPISQNPTIGLLTAEFAERKQLAQRYRIQQQRHELFQGVRGSHYLEMSTGLVQLSLQSLDLSAAGVGIEARHPFYDRRLLEFCLSLPTHQKLAGGWTRIVLRRAMQGILPHTVQWRVVKGNLSPGFHRNFWTQERDLVLSDHTFESIRPYIDLQEIHRLRTTYAQAQERDDFTPRTFERDGCALWFLTQLAVWLSLLGSIQSS